MIAKLFVSTFFLSGGLSARAEETQSKFDASTSPKPKTKWNPNPVLLDQIIRNQRNAPELQIGKSHCVVNGALFERLRCQRSSPDRSLGQKILELPIVRLLGPQPTPFPPGGGGYFHWGESDLPWTAIAQGAAPGAYGNAVTHEASASLISIHR